MAQNTSFDSFSMDRALAFAASPAGKQILSILQASGTDLSKAQDYAASGDMEKLKKELSSVLSDPRVIEMLKKFGG